MSDCIFCKIINKEIPGKIVYEDDECMAFLDLSQATYGHTLVIPKKHYANILEVDDETLAHVMKIVKNLANQIVEKLDAKGVNVLTNTNEVAGQTVHHFHIHILFSPFFIVTFLLFEIFSIINNSLYIYKSMEVYFMDNIYSGMAVGVFELDNLVACFVALDAASKAANVRIQSVERNRLKSGACVKMRGSVSDVNAAMEVALEAAKPLGKVVSHTVIASPSEDTEIALKMTINK